MAQDQDSGSGDHHDKARRSRRRAALSRRRSADAEDAVQECYLRALRYFEYVSRAGDEAAAFRHPARYLLGRILRPIRCSAHDG